LRSQLIDIDPELRKRVDQARLEALLQAWWERALAGDARAASIVVAAIELRNGLGSVLPSTGSAPAMGSRTDGHSAPGGEE
jgi:hypothetical protein